jgi:hypothetical protein
MMLSATVVDGDEREETFDGLIDGKMMDFFLVQEVV